MADSRLQPSWYRSILRAVQLAAIAGLWTLLTIAASAETDLFYSETGTLRTITLLTGLVGFVAVWVAALLSLVPVTRGSRWIRPRPFALSLTLWTVVAVTAGRIAR